MPSPGDLSICIYCGAFLEYDALLHSVPLSAAARQHLITQIPDQWDYMLEMQAKFRSSSKKFVLHDKPKVQ